MPRPLVTVICLCYNHADYVKLAVESVIHQSYPSIEIIVWDDASTDGSPDVIKELQKNYPHLKVNLSATNEGNCRAFNRAWQGATGEYVIDFSTDDIMHVQRVEKQVDFFETLDEKTGVVFTDATVIDEGGKTIRHHYEHLFHHKLIKKIATGDVFRSVLTTYYIVSPTMMMRRVVLDSLHGYDEQLSYEDFDLWVRSARLFRYAFLDERLTFIRKLSSSLSARAYRPGDQQLLSTYLVCVKAVALCRDKGDRDALMQRVRYEVRLSALTGNYRECKLFFKLLQDNGAVRVQDLFWKGVAAMPLPVGWVRELYQRVRYTRW